MNPRASACSPLEALTRLVYELLDAHRDTIELAVDRPELEWRAHVAYLRGLQRSGRALLARAASSSVPPTRGQHR